MDKKLCYGCMKYLDEDVQQCDCGFDPDKYEPAPHQLIPGTLLHERYLVGKVIGEGGFGITYVGRDTVLEIKVAIKEFYMSGYVNRNNTVSTIVRASIGNNAELFDRNKEKFLTEARVLARFADEEGIVGIRDYFQENNTAYIVMDFLTGETLRDCLAHRTKLSWQETLGIMRPVLNSLANIHEHQVIHRDISPDNIMLTTDGKVKLLDFGAAREVSQNDIKSLSVILKPGYAPEEQYRSKGQQGPWTDIYALCATIYCCVTGVVPDDAMERMFEDKLRAPHEIEDSCKLAVSEVIMKGMAVRQKDRYKSILELQADLAKAETAPEGVSLGIGNEGRKEDAPSLSDKNATIYAEELYQLAENKNATVYAEEIRAPKNDHLDVATIETSKEQAPREQETEDRMPQKKEIEEQAPQKQEAKEQTPLKQETKEQVPQKQEAKEQVPQKQEAKEQAPLKQETKEQVPQKKEAKEQAPQKKEQKKDSHEKTPKSKILITAIAVIAVLCIGGVILSGLSNSKKAGSTSGSDVSLSKELTSLQKGVVVINSKEIKLPILYSDFVKCGWDAKDLATLDQILSPQATSVEIRFLNVDKGFGNLDVKFYNPSDSEKKLEDCYIYYIYCAFANFNEGNYAQKEDNTFVIKNNTLDLVVGETSNDDFSKMFAQKKDSSYRFVFSDTHNMNLIFAADILRYIYVTNNAMPSDYADSYLSTAPEYDQENFIRNADPGCYVELTRQDGSVYEFRTSVLLQDYLDAGWTIEDGPEYLAARKETRLHIRKDARTTQEVNVTNPTGEARSIENCFVTKLTLSNSSLLTGDCVKMCFPYDEDRKIICNESYDDTYQELEKFMKSGYLTTSDGNLIQLSPDEGKRLARITYANSNKGFSAISIDSNSAVKEFFQNN